MWQWVNLWTQSKYLDIYSTYLLSNSSFVVLLANFLLEHHGDKLDCNSMFLVKLQRPSTNLAGETPDVPSLVQGNMALLYHDSIQGRGKTNYNY